MTSHAGLAAWSRARRILCVRLDGLGDVLMCTPAFAALKAADPSRELTLLCSPAGAALAPHLPDIDRIWRFEAPWVRHEAPTGNSDVQRLVAGLAAERFDAAVLMTTVTQSVLPIALVCLLAGIPLRVGHCRENPYALLSEWVSETDVLDGPIRHEVDRQLDLVAAIGAWPADRRLRMQLSEADHQAAGAWLGLRSLSGKQPYVVVHPGATAPSRRYPTGHFIEALALFRREIDCPVIVTGVAGERDLCQQIASALPNCVNAAGELGLGAFAALLDHASIVVACNSGPMHMAAALGRPLVVPYALTNPQHTPWQRDAIVLRHDVPCRHCLKSRCPRPDHDCLTKISPSAVADAALLAWRRSDASSRHSDPLPPPG